MSSPHHRDPNTIPSALPADYTRRHNYADWEALHPGVPPPAAYINEDLDAIEQALAETQDRAALIQREDGALQNEIVTVDSLHPDTAGTLLSQLGIDAAAVVAAAADAQAAAVSADADAATADNAATTATGAAVAAASSAADAQAALESLESQIVFLDQANPPANLPVSGGETQLDYLDAEADIDSIELFKNGLMLFPVQDYTKAAITGGIRFTLGVAAIVSDKYWVRTPEAYVPAAMGIRVGAVEDRVDALEALGIANSLSILTGDIAAVAGDLASTANALSIVTGDVATNTAGIADHESRIDALELGGVTPEISADTTKTVGAGGDYATFTAALAALKFTRVLPGATLTLQMTGNVTEPGALVWDHPDSSRIVLDMNANSRTIALGGWDSTYSTVVQERIAAAFHVPAGACFITRNGTAARTLTLVSPNVAAPSLHSLSIMHIAGRAAQQSAASGTPGTYMVSVALTADTTTPKYALTGSGAVFGAEGSVSSLSAMNAEPFKVTLSAATLNTSAYPIRLSGCRGSLRVIGEGALGGGAGGERIVCYGGQMQVFSSLLGVWAMYGAKVEANFPASVVAGGGFLSASYGGEITVPQTAGFTRAGAGAALVSATHPGRIDMTSPSFDNATLANTDGVVKASGPGAVVTLKDASFTNPPASGTFKAVYLEGGASAVCSGVSYGGTFASNKSNATSTWSASTGQFLSN